MTGWSVMLRGIRYRAGRSLVVLLLAAFATLAAVLVPAYGRAAAQSVLTDGLLAAPATAAALTVTTEGSADTSAAHEPLLDTQATVTAALRDSPRLVQAFGPPVSSVTAEVLLSGGDRQAFAAPLVWHQGACTQLTLQGSCPLDPEQVVLSQRSAAAAGLTIGDTITVRPSHGAQPVRELTVVGLYAPLDSAAPFWGPASYFSFSQLATEGAAQRLDAVFTATEDDVRLSDLTPVSARLQYPLRPEAVRLADVAAFRAELAALGLRLNAAELQLETALLAIVDEVSADQEALSAGLPLIAVPLLALSWIVLFLLIAGLLEERGAELALARLRGFPGGRTTRFGLGETLLLIAVGTPLGMVAGLGLVELAAQQLLAPDTHVELRWPVFAAAGAGLVFAMLAAWLGARRTLTRPVLTLLRRVPERVTWRAGLAEGGLLVLALACLVAAAQDRTAPLALLAPAALALAAGLAAGRLLKALARLRLSMARRRGNVPTMLAAAQLARKPGAARTVAVLTAAVALLAFASASWDVAAQARDRHVDGALGAITVYQVYADHPEALADAVTAAAPDRQAMAVVRTAEQYGDGQVELIGVQTERLGDVAVWPDGGGIPAGLAERLKPASAPEPVEIGSDIRAQVAADDLGEVPLRVGILLARAGSPPLVAWLGDLQSGQRTYRASEPRCAGSGCRLAGLVLGRRDGTSGVIQAKIDVRELRSDGAAVPVRLADPLAWRVDRERVPGAQVTLTAGESFGAQIYSAGPGDVTVTYVDTPRQLPAVVSGPVPSPGGGQNFAFPGLAGAQQEFQVTQQVTELPRAGVHGLLFDLELAARAASVTHSLADASDLRYEVWANTEAGDTAGLAAALAEQGVRVWRIQTKVTELDRLGRRAPALGFRLYLLAGVAAAALALGVVVLSIRLGAAERRAELSALRTAGIQRRVLRRALRRERTALLVWPLLLGLVAGVGAAILMLPGSALVIPRVPSAVRPLLWEAWLPDLSTPSLPALPLALVAAVLVAVLTLAVAGRGVREVTE